MNRLLKILFRISASLTIITIGVFAIISIAYKDSLIDYLTRDYFVKKVVQIKGMDSFGDGFTTAIPFCIIDNEKVIISTTKKLEIGKNYYVWYNNKTKHTYYTDSISKSFAFKFGAGAGITLSSFILSILFFISTKILRKKLIEKYGKESF